MSQTPSERLQRAYELIQSNNTTEAHRILSDYLATRNDDANAWWLLAYATEDVEEGKRALQNVLRLAPDHAQARVLLEEVEEMNKQATPNQPVAITLPKTPSFAEQLNVADASKTPLKDDFNDTFDFKELLAEPISSSRRLFTVFLAALALILLVGTLLFVGTQRGQINIQQVAVTPSETPTLAVAIIPTTDVSVSTEEAAVVPTDSTVLSAQQAQPFIDALDDVTLISNGLEIIATRKGNAVSASVCSAPSSRAIRDTVFATMRGLSSANEAASDLSAQAIAVKVFDCAGDNTLLRFITVDLASAKEYADGVIDESQFASLWDVE